ncbi:hypothetical protein Tco_1503328 [Tanacetum coccineum]
MDIRDEMAASKRKLKIDSSSTQVDDADDKVLKKKRPVKPKVAPVKRKRVVKPKAVGKRKRLDEYVASKEAEDEEVFSTWMAFRGINVDLGLSRGGRRPSVMQFLRDLSSDDIEDLTMALSFICVICFVNHFCQPPWETQILSVLLEITPDLATRAIGTPFSSSKGTMWCLFYLKPSGWCKRMLIQDFVSEDPNINQGFLKLVGSLDFDVAKGKEHSGFFSIFPLAYQASNGLNVFSRIHLNMGGFLPRVGPCSFFLRERTAKLHNDILMV